MIFMTNVNQNLLLSRILTYLDGTLFNDSYYKIGNFIVAHYLEIENMDEATFLEQGPFKRLELQQFMGAFGFDDYEEFKLKLYNDYQIRLNQIRVRLIDVKPIQFLRKLDMTINEDEMAALVSDICAAFYHAKRIFIFGALYPISLAIELQTDMITFGKPFYQFHHYNPIELTEDDVAIIVSGTGRAYNHMKQYMVDLHVERAQSLLLTQNKKFLNEPLSEKERVLVLPGKFDSVDFNYQLMAIYDLIRLQYFQQYYL